MNKLSVFEYDSNSVRIIEKDGEPWFVAKDLCDILEIGNTSQCLSRLEDDEKNTIILNDRTPGNPSTAIVSESGMYALVLSSRKPEAKPFRKWVTSEVLPTIRKTGSYSLKDAPTAQLPQQRDAIAYIEAANIVERVNNLTLRELLRDELIDELSVKRRQKTLVGTANQYTTVKVRAKELGYSTKEISNGSALGKFVARILNPDFIERVGKYDTRHYLVSEDLDMAIKAYFDTSKR